MGWLIRLALFLIVLTLVRSLVARLFSPKSTQRRSRPSKRTTRTKRTIEGHMVKDPQCGIYVATDLAIIARSKDETLHFCSEECRDKFLQATKS